MAETIIYFFISCKYLACIQYIYEGEPPKTEFIHKKLCIYSYMLKLQSLSKHSPFDAIHLQRVFSPLLKTASELIDFDAV